MGYDLRVSDEDIVNQSPIIGVERAHLKWLARCLHSLGDPPNFLVHAVFLDRTEMPTVHFDALGVRMMSADNAVYQILEIVQAVTIMADDRFTLAGMDLQARAIMGLLDFDRRRIPEVSEHRVENLGCGFHCCHDG